MSEIAPTGGDAALAPPERLHPLFLITGLGKSVRGAWGLIAGGAVLGSQGRWHLVALIAIAAVAFSVGALLIKWLKLEYRVGAHELRIDSGFLSRTSRAIPFDRVTDVDIEQGPVHRLFGLARVRFETGASAGAKNEDGVLDTITLARAESLREHIRNRRGLSVAPAVEEQEATAPLFAMDKRRVLTAGFFNFSLAVIAGLFGVTQTVGDVIGFDPFRRRFWNDILERSEPIRELMLTHQYIAAIGGSILLVLIGAGTGILRTLLREYGFRLDRTDSGLRRRRGLVTLTDVSIPVKRVQAAILATGPLRRAFGWCELKLQSLAMDGARGDHVVAPLARPAEAAMILDTLDWPADPGDDDWRAVSRGHVTAFAAMLALPMLIALAAALLQPWNLVFAVGGAVALVVRYLGWRQTRYALSDNALFIERGWWRRRRAIVPLIKIQSVELAESVWTRAFHYCSLTLGVAGGGGFSAHVVPALSRATAERLRERLVAS